MQLPQTVAAEDQVWESGSSILVEALACDSPPPPFSFPLPFSSVPSPSLFPSWGHTALKQITDEDFILLPTLKKKGEGGIHPSPPLSQYWGSAGIPGRPKGQRGWNVPARV